MFSNIRQDGVNQVDFSAIKNIRIRERVSLQYRCEMFNALNHPNFAAPTVTPTNSNFGKITSQGNLPRSIQMAVRLVW
jgi:hypothetical protein